MSAAVKKAGFPWILAAIGAAGVVAGAFVLLRAPQTGLSTDMPAPPKVELTQLGSGGGEVALREELTLLDPRPLFLPTDRNAGRANALADTGRREPSASFEQFPAQLAFKEENIDVAFPATVDVPTSPVDALRTEQGRDALSSLGRMERVVEALPKRLGYIEVVRAESGGVALSEVLPVVEGAPQEDWAPVELVVAVGPAGLIGLPVLMSSSGSQGLDTWLPTHLAMGYRLGERLPPGFYRIRVGP